MHFSILPNSIQVLVRIELCRNASNVYPLEMKLLLERENDESVLVNDPAGGVMTEEGQSHVCARTSV